ncbi:CbiQ1 [Desulforapulum autotrophicum HRM2]|uniref:CbiQ1 n=1 Tax=Desulforapulum autotrophicum (strain ATCC 43914 / DSM 3382 / VKM B-1955 / HRM2) TaxID=177437 RepID=C0QES5_DESAH|nr:cobalt ECF transporter T component CbiQ [Desulforapulum autotrophicum]ACN15417.1 CbiQ1 [Desulforapulum autotrophicum HRM2]
MIDEELALGDSFIHRLDPCVRVISAFVVSFALALSNGFGVLGLYFFFALTLVWLASLEPKAVVKRLKPMLLFVLMIWVILPFTFEGEAFAHLGPLTITRPGLALCLRISIKSVAILLVFIALLATMTVATLGQALHRLKIPDKMVFLLLMTYRYISVIHGEYLRLVRAARLRGFIPGTNLHSYKTYAYIAGMLFVRASLRAERVHKAMLCRGFSGKFLTLDTPVENRLNPFFMAGVSVATLALVVMETMWK